jgi:hypothetical protein
MSEESPDQIKLNDLMFQALDHAVASIGDSGGPLTPFSMCDEVCGKKTLTRYAAERLEESVAQGKQRIEEAKADLLRYAFAWDGFVTIEGKKWDAILVEAGDKVAETGILLCQRYQKKGFFRKGVEPVGNPALIGKPPSRIK